MSSEAQEAFLFGDPEPIEVEFHSRKGVTTRRTVRFPGFFGWIRDWDVGGTYTDTVPCPDCHGERLRPQYRSITLNGRNMHDLGEMALAELTEALAEIAVPEGLTGLVSPSLETIQARLRFLQRVGLSYLNMHRITSTLSAGEAQRIKLAGLLSSELTALTVLLDEPSRGLHPSEVSALREALVELTVSGGVADGATGGNTVILVEHDLELIKAADKIIDMGPGVGTAGGQVIAQGTVQEVAAANTPTGRWLRRTHGHSIDVRHSFSPRRWLTVVGARANNLAGDSVRIPLGALTGICGVSGSG